MSIHIDGPHEGRPLRERLYPTPPPPITVTLPPQLAALVDHLGQLITELRAIADIWAQHLGPAALAIPRFCFFCAVADVGNFHAHTRACPVRAGTYSVCPVCSVARVDGAVAHKTACTLQTSTSEDPK